MCVCVRERERERERVSERVEKEGEIERVREANIDKGGKTEKERGAGSRMRETK